ncbi:MAG: type I-MYXAN CRISPR-associated endonuclease Cas1 [Nitrososphaerota archaeon]|nr:type I-MYXAN CRISPR-associated endonuclease Cas1 [Nitrososphaerota archaeon]
MRPAASDEDAIIHVAGLHALSYCERLFYLEEVEGIRLADDSVYAGRALHELLAKQEKGHRVISLRSARLGLAGEVDAVHYREGGLVPYEHKRGHAKRQPNGKAGAWPWDALQVVAYAMLIEDETGKIVPEGRIRYHADNITVRIPLTDEGRKLVLDSIESARQLRRKGIRPPVNSNENACIHCSLAPVCLPEEERLLASPQWEAIRLFPATVDGEVVHLLTPSTVRKNGEALMVKSKGEALGVYPIRSLLSIIAHGNVQITTQALHLCAYNDVSVHWFTSGGRHISALTTGPASVQRRIRQYQALCDPAMCLSLVRKLVSAKVENQLKFVLRATRKAPRIVPILRAIEEMRASIRAVQKADGIDSLRGIEGSAARAYFNAIPHLLKKGIDEDLRPAGRNRRPPLDKFNALLSFGYSLLYGSTLQAITAVGLEPSLGFFHTPRSSGQPLALDIMELFRVPVWDMIVITSINRQQWNSGSKFEVTKEHVWLSKVGKREVVELFENRMNEVWKHPVTGYSLSWRRAIELEVRLLEKEWSSTPGLFARARIR